MPYCRKCGEQIVGDATFCIKCGTSIHSKDEPRKASGNLDAANTKAEQHNWSDLAVGHIISNRYVVLQKMEKDIYLAVYRVFDKELAENSAQTAPANDETGSGKQEKILRILPEAVTSNKGLLHDYRQEVQVMSTLHHPGIISIFDFAMTEGIAYTTSEYFTGETFEELQHSFASGKVPEATVKEYAAQIIDAMAYAHKKGVLHKDLTLHNVMVSASGEVKITDFGTAKAIESSKDRLKNDSLSSGRNYLSPEQVRGEIINRSSDVYSFGILLYDLLYGSPPFTEGDLFHQILTSKPRPLEDISASFNKIIMKCLEKDAERRYQDFNELLTVWQSMFVDDNPEEQPLPEEKETARDGLVYRKPAGSKKFKYFVFGLLKFLFVTALIAGAAYGAWRLWEYRNDYIASNLLQAEELMQSADYETAREHFQKVLVVDRRNETALKGIDDIYETIAVNRIKDPAMAFVRGGSFQMGNNEGRDNEKPLQTVSLDDFYMAKVPVTQRDWTMIMGTNPSHFTGNNLPVENISWYDILVFCNLLSIKQGFTPVYSIRNNTNPKEWGRVPSAKNAMWDGVRVNWNADGYRMPTETEWEYAAKGGRKSSGYKFSGSANIEEVAWYNGNSGARTRFVGQKKSNELGIFDMSGNVGEWCWDIFGDYTPEIKNNPRGVQAGDYCVIRGGGWYENADACRVTYRNYEDPSGRMTGVGFRYVRVLK